MNLPFYGRLAGVVDSTAQPGQAGEQYERPQVQITTSDRAPQRLGEID